MASGRTERAGHRPPPQALGRVYEQVRSGRMVRAARGLAHASREVPDLKGAALGLQFIAEGSSAPPELRKQAALQLLTSDAVHLPLAGLSPERTRQVLAAARLTNPTDLNTDQALLQLAAYLPQGDGAVLRPLLSSVTSAWGLGHMVLALEHTFAGFTHTDYQAARSQLRSLEEGAVELFRDPQSVLGRVELALSTNPTAGRIIRNHAQDPSFMGHVSFDISVATYLAQAMSFRSPSPFWTDFLLRRPGEVQGGECFPVNGSIAHLARVGGRHLQMNLLWGHVNNYEPELDLVFDGLPHPHWTTVQDWRDVGLFGAHEGPAPSYAYTAAALNNLSNLVRMRAGLDQARPLREAALAILPENSSLLLNMFDVTPPEGRVELLDRVLEIAPNHPVAHSLKAQWLIDATQRYDDARLAMEQAFHHDQQARRAAQEVVINPTDISQRAYEVGVTFLEAGRREDAAYVFAELLARNPGQPQIMAALTRAQRET